MVVVGNEFLDTMPVHLVRVGGGTLAEAYVEAEDRSLGQTWAGVSEAAAAELELLFGTLDPRRLEAFTEDGIIEVFPGLGGLLRRVARVMPSGSFVNVDYGEWFPGLPLAGGPRGGEAREAAQADDEGLLQASDGPRPPRPSRQAGSDRRRRLRRARSSRTAARVSRPSCSRPLPRSCGGRGGGRAAGAAQWPEAARPDPAPDVLEADRQATVLQNLLDERDLGGAFKLMVQVRE